MKKFILVILAVIGVLFIEGKDQRAYAMVHSSFHSSSHVSSHSSFHSSSKVGRSTFKSPSRSGSSIKSGSTYKGSVKTPKVSVPKTSKAASPKVKSNSNFKGKPIKNADIPTKVKPHSSKSLGFNETNYRPSYESSFSSPRFWMWYWMFNHHDYKDSKGVIHKSSKINWLRTVVMFVLGASLLILIFLIIWAILL